MTHGGQSRFIVGLFCLRNRRVPLLASAAANLLPVAHQVRDFSDALVSSVFTPHDGDDLIQQIYLDWVFFARVVYLDQRGSEPMHATLLSDVVRQGARDAYRLMFRSKLSINGPKNHANDGSLVRRVLHRLPTTCPVRLQRINVTRERHSSVIDSGVLGVLSAHQIDSSG